MNFPSIPCTAAGNPSSKNDLDGLIDKRGKWKKGKSDIQPEAWDAFLYFYLQEAQHPMMKCYEYMKLLLREDHPDLVADLPSYTTFTRRVKSDIPEAVEVLGREGQKAFRDRCAPYIRRIIRKHGQQRVVDRGQPHL